MIACLLLRKVWVRGARMRGRMQPVNGGFRGGGGGDFGQWTCTNPQCRANRCWPTESKCFRCGAPKGYGLTQDPPGWQQREQHHPGRPVQVSRGIAPTMSKKAAKAARREAAVTAASGFPTPVPLTKIQALELLKRDLDGELFLELQTRLAKPKVVPPLKRRMLCSGNGLRRIRPRIFRPGLSRGCLISEVRLHRLKPSKRSRGSGC